MSSIHSRLGYACINTELREAGVYTGRTMNKKTFLDQRSTNLKVYEIAKANLQDLITIIFWNESNGIKFFRIGSDIFPWASEYEFTDLPNWNELATLLKQAGALANSYKQRVGFHPGPFNVLASLNPDVVSRTIVDLNKHAEILDYMGIDQSPWGKINIHVNTTQGGKEDSAKRFCEGFKQLSESCRKRLVVENDDKPSQYSVSDLHRLIHNEIGIPITFDVHHHKYCSGGLSYQEAADLAVSTWPIGIPPAFHFASTIQHEDPTKMARAHADWLYEPITDYGTGAWIMCECKAKEQAVLHYIKNGPKASSFVEQINL